ncbi:hypothetical protein SNEBB_002193 [Seison nebaliae]|nr:hypothetical protein SNEBB_002193 [Seison nebaliae]
MSATEYVLFDTAAPITVKKAFDRRPPSILKFDEQSEEKPTPYLQIHYDYAAERLENLRHDRQLDHFLQHLLMNRRKMMQKSKLEKKSLEDRVEFLKQIEQIMDRNKHTSAAITMPKVNKNYILNNQDEYVRRSKNVNQIRIDKNILIDDSIDDNHLKEKCSEQFLNDRLRIAAGKLPMKHYRPDEKDNNNTNIRQNNMNKTISTNSQTKIKKKVNFVELNKLAISSKLKNEYILNRETFQLSTNSKSKQSNKYLKTTSYRSDLYQAKSRLKLKDEHSIDKKAEKKMHKSAPISSYGRNSSKRNTQSTSAMARSIRELGNLTLVDLVRNRETKNESAKKFETIRKQNIEFNRNVLEKANDFIEKLQQEKIMKLEEKSKKNSTPKFYVNNIDSNGKSMMQSFSIKHFVSV